MARSTIRTVQRVPVPEPRAFIDTADQGAPEDTGIDHEAHLLRAMAYAEQGGDISDMLEAGELTRLGTDAVRQWHMDSGSREDWLENAKAYLDLAAQESDDEDVREPIWDGAADINYPILSTASGQFLARAAPELIKGDKVVGVKVFSPPTQKPDPIEAAKAGPQPQDDQEAQMATMAIQQAQQQAQQVATMAEARNARAERIKHFLNWLIFYQMDDWEGDSDLLLLQASIIGTGFKKVYMGPSGLRSEFLSATCLTVHNDTASIHTCPRITHEFPVYPYEIEDRIRAGIYRDITLPRVSEDPERSRNFIEQHRLDDLDGDGLAEPYIVTVDVETQQVMRVEPAYGPNDITVDSQTGRILRIDRWLPFPAFTFLPDPRGRFYGIGLGALLESITDSVDTSLNQLIDAGTAQIAGGGFIGANLRLQGSGQGGSIFFRPGEYQTVSAPGANVREAIWERTVPQPSAVTMQMLEMLLAAAKDIASIKDVITGDAPSTAPWARRSRFRTRRFRSSPHLQAHLPRFPRRVPADVPVPQALGHGARAAPVHRTDRRRLRRGFLRRRHRHPAGGGPDRRLQDAEDRQDADRAAAGGKPCRHGGGNDPAGTGPGLDPGRAGRAGRGPAGAVRGSGAPNPELIAKAQDTQAAAMLKQADARKRMAEVGKIGVDAAKVAAEARHTEAKTTHEHAETLHALAENTLQHHTAHVIADQIQQTGSLQPPAPEPEGGEAQ
jgi:hypothetical protein